MRLQGNGTRLPLTMAFFKEHPQFPFISQSTLLICPGPRPASSQQFLMKICSTPLPNLLRMLAEGSTTTFSNSCSNRPKNMVFILLFPRDLQTRSISVFHFSPHCVHIFLYFSTRNIFIKNCLTPLSADFFMSVIPKSVSIDNFFPFELWSFPVFSFAW